MKQIFDLLPNCLYRIKSEIPITAIEIRIVELDTQKEYGNVMDGANYVKYTHHRKRYIAPVINNIFKSPDFKIRDKTAFFIMSNVDVYGIDSSPPVEIERKVEREVMLKKKRSLKHSLTRGDKKKVCYITSNSCVGGVEKLTMMLLKHITDYHKTVIVTDIKGAFHSEYEKYSDVCFFERSKENVKAFLETNYFDVYHIFNSLIGLDLLDKMDGRIVLSLFGDYTFPTMWFKMRKDVFIKNVEFIDVITTDNKKNVDILGDFPIQVNNGIEIPEIETRKRCSTEPIVAWIGRNSGEKRPDVLYRTAKNCKDVRFLVAIGNVYNVFNEEYTGTLQMLQTLPNVILWVNANEKDVYFILEQAAIILNTSMMEGIPVALLEGMARGCYPIVPNVGEVADLVEGVGTVVDDLSIQDYSQYIHEALIRCGGDPDLVNKVRDRIVKKHDIENFVRVMKRIYNGDVNADKTVILAMANKINIVNRNDRLDAFVSGEPWKLESNMDYARKLYRALLDVELESVPYWVNIVKKGYARKKTTDHFFYTALEINNDNAEYVTDIQKNIIKNLGKYDDDNPDYSIVGGY